MKHFFLLFNWCLQYGTIQHVCFAHHFGQNMYMLDRTLLLRSWKLMSSLQWLSKDNYYPWMCKALTDEAIISNLFNKNTCLGLNFSMFKILVFIISNSSSYITTHTHTHKKTITWQTKENIWPQYYYTCSVDCMSSTIYVHFINNKPWFWPEHLNKATVFQFFITQGMGQLR